jgi:hypothetical protein
MAQSVIILLTNSLSRRFITDITPFMERKSKWCAPCAGSTKSFVVKLPEGLQIGVPAWMLDAVFCSQLQQRDHPSIALRALLELVQLIDAQRLPSSVINSESGPSPRRGGIDALRTEEVLSSTEAALYEKGAVGKTSRTPSSSLARADR